MGDARAFLGAGVNCSTVGFNVKSLTPTSKIRPRVTNAKTTTLTAAACSGVEGSAWTRLLMQEEGS